jgi:DNA-binding transcriptional MerR regulator
MSTELKPLPAIPAKRYFTIVEVSDLCGVKAYVLRYWEQEFTQLKPMKRRGNRRYYQHHEVLLIRRIRDLLYEQGFTISGARNQLTDTGAAHLVAPPHAEPAAAAVEPDIARVDADADATTTPLPTAPAAERDVDEAALAAMADADLALIERAQRGTGEFADTATHARAAAQAVASAGARAAALQTRRTSPATSTATASPATHGELSTPETIRAELLAIRALLVG